MKNILVIFGFFILGVTPAFAYDLFVTEVAKPYSVVPITVDEYNKSAHLGSLDGFPVMYEFSFDTKSDLTLQLTDAKSSPANATGFSLMVVRQNDDGGGVTEVARQMAGEVEWTIIKDKVFGMTFLENEPLKLTLEPGVYRVEVSTPINEGRYMLTVGSESDPLGYFETIGRVWTIQDHFGYSFLRILGSSYVYYPFGIFLLLFAIYRTWRLRNKIAYDN